MQSQNSNLQTHTCMLCISKGLRQSHIFQNGMQAVNLTYTPSGRLQHWSQGSHEVLNAYDSKTGFLIQRTIADSATTRYLYKSKSKVRAVCFWI